MKMSKRNYERDTKIVFYREKGGWTFPRIAEKFGITKGRVRVLYTRIVEERDNVNKHMGIGA